MGDRKRRAPESHQGEETLVSARHKAARKPLWRRWQFWAAIPLVLLALAFGFERYSIHQVQQQVASEKQLVDERCREEVSSYAKYPGGVIFQDPIFPAQMLDEGSEEFYLGRARPEGSYVYRQTGEVDFPNAFGTPLRYGYSCVYAVTEDLTVAGENVALTETDSNGVSRRVTPR